MQPLFRAEALDHATQRLDGEVLLPAPLVTWGAVGLVAAVLALAVWFAATATYAPTESAHGWLAPAGGGARAVSRRDGNVFELLVVEGDVVEAGTPLARVASPAHFGDGRVSLAFNSPPPDGGTYKGNPFDDAGTGSASDATDKQAVPPEVAVQALAVSAAHTLLRDIAKLSQHGLGRSFDGSADRDSDHIVTAPISGRVETVVAREGQYIFRGSTVALVAASDELVAEVLVPSHVVGLVTNGQGLRLKYEGLPFGRQGIQHGIVTHVSRSPLTLDDIEHMAVPVTGPVYRAQIRLPAQEIDVGGVRVDLHAGMRLSAEVPTPRRTLFQTLYETIR